MEESNTKVQTSKLKRKKIIIQKGEDTPVVKQNTISPSITKSVIQPYDDPEQSPGRLPGDNNSEGAKKVIKSEESKRLESTTSNNTKSLPKIEEKGEIKRKLKKRKILKKKEEKPNANITKNDIEKQTIDETPDKLKANNPNVSINTENSALDMNLSGFDQQKLRTTTKLELGIFDKSNIKKTGHHEGVGQHEESKESGIFPIFKSFLDTHIFMDLIRIRHPFFTRYIRWTLIFYDIFLTLLQIVCMLDLTDNPVRIPKNQSITVYAFSKIWISMYSSLITQIVIFGVAFLLRYKEKEIIDPTRAANIEEFNKKFKKTKRIRYLIFFISFIILMAITYFHIITFSLSRPNEVAASWMILFGISLIFDFFLTDFLLLVVQLWINGISSKYESKIRTLRNLKVAKEISAEFR